MTESHTTCHMKSHEHTQGQKGSTAALPAQNKCIHQGCPRSPHLVTPIPQMSSPQLTHPSPRPCGSKYPHPAHGPAPQMTLPTPTWPHPLPAAITHMAMPTRGRAFANTPQPRFSPHLLGHWAPGALPLAHHPPAGASPRRCGMTGSALGMTACSTAHFVTRHGIPVPPPPPPTGWAP